MSLDAENRLGGCLAETTMQWNTLYANVFVLQKQIAWCEIAVHFSALLLRMLKGKQLLIWWYKIAAKL